MVQGIIICLGMALAATWLTTIQHVISAPLMGLFLGIIIANCMLQKFLANSKAGAGFCSKRILRVGIIFAGGTLNFKGIALGASNLSSVLSTLYKFCFAMALVSVGYKIKIKDLFTKGVKPIVLGGLTWSTVSVATLVYAAVLR